jgi:hypothetical protein
MARRTPTADAIDGFPGPQHGPPPGLRGEKAKGLAWHEQSRFIAQKCANACESLPVAPHADGRVEAEAVNLELRKKHANIVNQVRRDLGRVVVETIEGEEEKFKEKKEKMSLDSDPSSWNFGVENLPRSLIAAKGK